MSRIYGGIEGGGTKFVCVVAGGPDEIRAETRFPTTTPEETIRRAIEFFQQAGQPLAAIGIASFGPLDLDTTSPQYGYITSTPKPGWAYTDLVGAVKSALDLPVGFDTDVNGAALSEARWGAGVGVDPLVYYTIGTGIGAGVVVNSAPLHGLVHPEAGHVLLPHDRTRDPFPGRCPYHRDCFEGLANGPAMNERWGARAETLPSNHPAWELEAEYIAAALVQVICTLSPRRIILGGGVMQQPALFPLVRQKTKMLLNGYVDSPVIRDQMDTYIVPPGLGTRSGMLGAVALAQDALAKS